MNWAAISTFAEVISAVAVVLSLVYVGIQVRQSNQLSRANTFHLTNTQYSHVMSQLSDPRLAKLYRQAISGEELVEDDFVSYSAFLISYFVFLEDVHFQQQSGLFTVELGTSDVMEFMALQAAELLVSKQSQEWWEIDAPKFLSPGFYTAASENMKIKRAG